MKKNTCIQVTLTPKASCNKVVPMPSTGIMQVKVYVTEVPEKGKANKAMLQLLAAHLKVPLASLVLVRGHAHRHKQIRVCV